jgi:hypothetical protein
VFINEITSRDISSSLSMSEQTVGNFAIDYSFRNHGRTPAILRDIRIGAYCLEAGSLPNIEHLQLEVYRVPGVISADSKSPSHRYVMKMDGAQYERAKAGNAKIFFYGELGYSDVFGTDRRTLGFCAEWDFSQGVFLFTQNEKLNYRT